MTSPAAFSDEISAVRLRSLGADEWAAILSGDPHDAARWIHAAAQHGFKAAQVIWGQMLLDGRGVAPDRAAAFRWFYRAAEIGSVDGVNMVGRCYELGWGVAVDHCEAVRWYRKAALRSSDWGQYNLASMLLYGEDIERDRGQALQWYLRAARQGHAKAMGMVGRFHEEGWEVPASTAAAMHWYLQAAEGGDFWGQYHLARLLAEDRPDAALKWLRQSIEGGTQNFLRTVGPTLLDHAQVAFQEVGIRALERCCESNVAEDFYACARALMEHDRRDAAGWWLRRASERGHREAQHALCRLAGSYKQPAHRWRKWVVGILQCLHSKTGSSPCQL